MRIALVRGVRIFAALLASLAVSCSHEPPQPTAEQIAARQKEAADAEQAKASKLAAAKAAAEAKALYDAQVKLDADVAALRPAPPIPPAPAYLGEVVSPPENPATADKIWLGRALFFDKRLSKDGSMSCESCHHPALAFTSGNALDAKASGKLNTRNAPSMLNLGHQQNGYYWDGRQPTLEAVSQAAWAGQLSGDPIATPGALNLDPIVRALFQRAFGGEATAQNIPQALAAYLRALQSGDSAWDKLDGGDAKAVSADAKAGFKIFTEKGCALCHLPPLYSDTQFHDVGIGWDSSTKSFVDHGRMEATKDPADDGKFKTPSLRDVARTGPWFHDGSAKTLEEAIDRMAKGGVSNPRLDAKLKPGKLSRKQREQLKAFLETLNGSVPP